MSSEEEVTATIDARLANAGRRVANADEVIRALAETHVELVLIHPFRDGNGRVARVLASLMRLQAGLPLLDFRSIAEEKKQEYFTAVQSGLDRNYEPTERLFLASS